MVVFSLIFSLISLIFNLIVWILLLSLPFGVAYYFYLKHRSTYFQRIGLSQPPITSIFLGNLEEFEKDHKQHEKLVEWHEKYGPTFGMLQGAHRVIVTSDMNILNEVFVKQFHTFQARMIHPSFVVDQVNGRQLTLFFSQGNQWKRLRALFSSSLTISKIKSVEPIMEKAHDELYQVFKKNENKVIDIIPNILDMTFAFISRSALGINEEFGKSEYLHKIVNILGPEETSKSLISSFFAGTWDFLSITKHFQILQFLTVFREAFKLRDNIIKAITERENEPPTSTRRRDFLDFLREAQEEDFDTTNKPDLDMKIPKKITRDELIGASMAYLFGGADTTATLINYCLYELTMHPECEEIILQEIDDYIKNEDDVNYNNVKNLEFLDRFIKETGRLHPFAYLAAMRRAIESATVQTSNGNLLQIDKHTAILPNMIVISKDENVWGKDAAEFNPDRFLPENSKNRHPLAWMLFGAGPRICPGKNLAIYETKATLIRLLQEFKFELHEKSKLNEVTKTFMSFESLKMKIIPRKIE
uniref:Cytochrome P450 n=1 Tax=Panagrolaimus sp. PS1159 TaxID=55785 RepID=A0AC35FZE3_9BILA